MSKHRDNIHWEFWLLHNIYYANKWLSGVPYEELLMEYKNKYDKG
jgi:hypothetical protein